MFVFSAFGPFDWLGDGRNDNELDSVVKLSEIADDARLVLDLKVLIYLGGASLKRSGRAARRRRH